MNGWLMSERILAGAGEDYMKLQLHLDKLAMVSWVDRLAPWQVISHLTFPWEASLDGARRGYERFMVKTLPHLSYFFAEEQNPGRPGYHVHALWADCKTLYRREAWAAWRERFRMGQQGARARIEPVRDRGDVASYCAKYVTKQRAWWNVKLQWHRQHALRGEAFALERASDSLPDSRLPVPQSEFPYAAEVFNLAADPPLSAAELPAVADDPRQAVLWRQRSDGVWEQARERDNRDVVEHVPLPYGTRSEDHT